MILLLDNYDSFTYNLFHYLNKLTDEEVQVIRNDVFDIASLKDYSRVVLSPGPGLPSNAGVMMKLLEEADALRIPVLGVCLGMQAIGEFCGGRLLNLEQPFHGVATEVRITDPDDSLFKGFSGSFSAGRYHSWVLSGDNLPGALKVTAVDPAGVIMAITHTTLPFTGVQFHPESVMTGVQGYRILSNWLAGSEMNK